MFKMQWIRNLLEEIMKRKSGIKGLWPFVLLVGIFTFSNLLVGCGPSKNELETAQVAREAAIAEAATAKAREAAAIAEAGRNKTTALILAIIIVPVALVGVGVGIHATRQAKEKKNAVQQANKAENGGNV
jgi:hypothetical protein